MNKLIEIFKNAEVHYYFVTNTDFFSISFFNHEYRNHGLPIAGYSHKECRLSLYDN